MTASSMLDVRSMARGCLQLRVLSSVHRYAPCVASIRTPHNNLRPCKLSRRFGSRVVQSSLQEGRLNVRDIDEEQLAIRLQGLKHHAGRCHLLETTTFAGVGLELQGCVDIGSYAAIYKARSVGRSLTFEEGSVSSDSNVSLPGVAGTIFAVKVLRSCMMDPDSTRDFRREALLLGRVDHPGIIKMYHYGKVPQPYMVQF